jgi:hypothetical protein
LRTRRDVLSVVSDTHIGSTTALCPSVVELDDGGTYKASPGQRWLWQSWQDYLAQVQSTKPTGGGKRYAVHLGDCIEGDHHNTSAVISRNPLTMLRLAVDILEPIRKWSDHLFVLRGTEAHSGEAGQWDETVADDLGAERDPSGDRASWWYLLFEIGGVLFDLAHHPPSNSGRAWTRANVATTLAYTVFSEYAERGEPVPDVALRGHIHKYTDSYANYPTRGVTCPAFQLATPYSSRRWPGQLAHIGGLIFVIENGEAHMRHVAFRPERGATWQESQNQNCMPRS